MEGRLRLNAIVREDPPVLNFLSDKRQPLLIRRNTFFAVNVALPDFGSVGPLHSPGGADTSQSHRRAASEEFQEQFAEVEGSYRSNYCELLNGAGRKVELVIVTCPAFELLPCCGPVSDLFHGIEAFEFLWHPLQDST